MPTRQVKKRKSSLGLIMQKQNCVKQKKLNL